MLFRKTRPRPGPAPEAPTPLPSLEYLAELGRRYQTQHLVNTDAAAFKARIDAFCGLDDYQMEGYRAPDHQRDLSIKFTWGHDHDFGGFRMEGRMKDRHARLLATFIDEFGALPRDLSGKRVLDIGGWTGGATLLLAAMGARVVMIEEVRKYVECAGYLIESFGLADRVRAERRSLYEATTPEFQDGFDYAFFCGVLYHVSDPLLALRIVFNCLAPGGRVLLETAAEDSPDCILRYHGPQRFTGVGTAEAKNRGGWNWFMPSPSALGKMMEDVGFRRVRTSGVRMGRAFAVGDKIEHTDMLRAGLAVPGIR